MTATRREVSIRWFNQLALDGSLSLSLSHTHTLCPSRSFSLSRRMTEAAWPWPGQFDFQRVAASWNSVTGFCESCRANYRPGSWITIVRKTPLPRELWFRMEFPCRTLSLSLSLSAFDRSRASRQDRNPSKSSSENLSREREREKERANN